MFDVHVHVPAIVQFPALHQGGLGCVGHWQQVHHQDQTEHTRNQVAPEWKSNSTQILLSKHSIYPSYL